MSLICLGIVKLSLLDHGKRIQDELKKVAAMHNRGICFKIDWYEPLVDTLENIHSIFSLTDSPESDNCEMLFLPDGCYCNEVSNNSSIFERMQYLQNLATIVLSNGHSIEYYIGNSGTLIDEYETISVQCTELSQCLVRKLNITDVPYAIHLKVN